MFKPHNFANENEDEYENDYGSDLIDSDFEG